MTSFSKLSILLMLFLLSACSSPGKNIVESAKTVKPLSYALATCGNMNLTRDCSNWSGATRKISLGDSKCMIAGTADGHTILVQIPLWTGFSQTEKINNCYTAVRAEIEKYGAKVNKTVPLGHSGQLKGYVIESDIAIYEILLEFTDKE